MKRDILLATLGFLGLGISLIIGGFVLQFDPIGRGVLAFCGGAALFSAGAIANDSTPIAERKPE